MSAQTDSFSDTILGTRGRTPDDKNAKASGTAEPPEKPKDMKEEQQQEEDAAEDIFGAAAKGMKRRMKEQQEEGSGATAAAAAVKKPLGTKRRVHAKYEVRRDISPLIHLKPEARNSNLVQFIELVQGRTHAPMNALVQEWMITGGDIDFSALGPVLKSAVFNALQDLTNICRKYRRQVFNEQEIIEDASHPYYHCFIELTSAHVIVSYGFSQKGYHPLRDSMRRSWALIAANTIAKDAVLGQPGPFSGGI